MAAVTIAVMPRDRFSVSAECLQRIFDHTEIPFDLILVDCDMPDSYRQAISQVLTGRENARILRADRYLLPNECRNLAIAEARGDLVCLVENDILVSDRWLSGLMAVLEEEEAGLAVPFLIEGRPGSQSKPHFDDNLGHVEAVQTSDGPRYLIKPRRHRKEDDVDATERRIVQFVETHCLLFRREVLAAGGLFDPRVNTSEEIDLSMALYHQDVRIAYDPRCHVHYVQPSFPVSTDDRAYFLMKWDVEHARESHRTIEEKWKLAEFPQPLGFVEERHAKATDLLAGWKQELLSRVGEDELILLVDYFQWQDTEATAGLNVQRFVEKGGDYWGDPPDEATAIEDLEQKRAEGAALLVLSWYAFWYLSVFGAFADHLKARYPKVVDNDHMIAFDLRG